MKLTKLKDIFSKAIKRGIQSSLEEKTKIDLEFTNMSLMSAIPPCITLGILFWYLSLGFASFAYFLEATYLLLAYFFFTKSLYPRVSIDKIGFISSTIIVMVNLVTFTYYGVTYGFQYFFIISLLFSLVNIKNPFYRKKFYLIVLSGLIISLLFLTFLEPMVEPSSYGNILNVVLLILTLFMVYRFSENYINMFERFDADQRMKVTDLESKNEAFQIFNRTVAHDLKEPLRTISGFTNLLFKNIKPTKSEESEMYITYINKGVGRMAALLEDLLGYIETSNKGTYDDEVDLNLALQYAEDNLFQKIKENEAEILKSDLPIIKSNLNFTVLLFQNLLSNAIKFVENGVKPEIKIQSEKTEKGLNILVIDNGIGIPDEHRDKIFEAFNQLNSKDKYGGSGLGLALCIKIVSSLKGTIEVLTSSSKGSTFQIFIPVEHLIKS